MDDEKIQFETKRIKALEDGLKAALAQFEGKLVNEDTQAEMQESISKVLTEFLSGSEE